ncbi:MAG: transposase [Gammaproteobacteria bacterium]|nr:transposase [Gammaproteobacteria bacterium]
MVRKTKYDFYDESFKATAVELGSLPGVYAKDVAEVLDIHPIMLYRWKKEVREGLIMKKPAKGLLDTETSQELKRLKKIEKAHKILKMEYEILKKSIQYCSNRKRKSLNT